MVFTDLTTQLFSKMASEKYIDKFTNVEKKKWGFRKKRNINGYDTHWTNDCTRRKEFLKKKYGDDYKPNKKDRQNRHNNDKQ